jgi:MSHA pilin protein MshC
MAICVDTRSSGFTLVELVMVIILIGVLSVLGVGLFANRSSFSPLLAAQQLNSAALLARQAAMAGNENNTVTVLDDGNSFTFAVGSIGSYSIPKEGTGLSVAGGLPLDIEFDKNGAPVSGNNLELSFIGESPYDICVSSLGAVYSGACQP